MLEFCGVDLCVPAALINEADATAFAHPHEPDGCQLDKQRFVWFLLHQVGAGEGEFFLGAPVYPGNMLAGTLKVEYGDGAPALGGIALPDGKLIAFQTQCCRHFGTDFGIIVTRH